jgi:hypothetical protein
MKLFTLAALKDGAFSILELNTLKDVKDSEKNRGKENGKVVSEPD